MEDKEDLLYQLLVVQDPDEEKEKQAQLVEWINHLLLHDFNALVILLYRVDVSEKRLRELLGRQPQTDAALLIARMLIERLREKKKTRESFRNNQGTIPEDEKW